MRALKSGLDISSWKEKEISTEWKIYLIIIIKSKDQVDTLSVASNLLSFTLKYVSLVVKTKNMRFRHFYPLDLIPISTNSQPTCFNLNRLFYRYTWRETFSLGSPDVNRSGTALNIFQLRQHNWIIKMLSGMANTAIVAGVGVVVIILASTLGWIAYPNIVVSVFYYLFSIRS